MSSPFKTPRQEFIYQVDLMAKIHDLDPELPELVSLKDRADWLIENGLTLIKLREINPKEDTIQVDSTLIIMERMFWGTLTPWTIARARIYDLDRQIRSIVATGIVLDL